MPTPTTGFFEVIAESVNLTGSNTWIFTGAANMKGVFNNVSENIGIQAQKDVPSNYNIQFGAKAFPDTATIVLNRGTADEETLSFAGLPSGFSVTYLELRILILFPTNNPMKFLYNDVPTGSYLPITSGLQQLSISPTPSLTETFFATNWGFDCDGTDGAGSSGTPIIRNCYKWGTYEILAYTWTAGKEGDNIRIQSPDSTPDLTTVDEIILQYTVGTITKNLHISSSKYIEWITTNILIRIPATCEAPGTTQVIGVISGVEHTITTVEIT